MILPHIFWPLALLFPPSPILYKNFRVVLKSFKDIVVSLNWGIVFISNNPVIWKEILSHLEN